MKVILSRKGMDSTFGNGNLSNLILDNKLIMLPIPEEDDSIELIEKGKICGYTYEKTNRDNCQQINMKGINIDYLKEIPDYEKFFKNDKNKYCHPDPNLTNLLNDDKFKASIGQVGSSLGHLKNQKIDVGDIFLFFGRFRHIKEENGKYVYDDRPNEPKYKHIIFGYMQIGEIINVSDKTQKSKINFKQPHLSDYYNDVKYKKKNKIYIAKDVCNFGNNIKGYGIFDYDEKLVLTDLKDKSGLITHWKLLEPFKTANMTYNLNGNKNDHFKANGRGQEYVINDKNNTGCSSQEVVDWAINLIEK